jgi:hypothetical protein
MVIKLDNIKPLELLLNEEKTACLYCSYYDREVGCKRIYTQTSGRTKIELTDPLNQTCKSFVPIFRCEDCYSYKVDKLKGALWGKTETVTCTRRDLIDEEIELCEDWEPNEEKKKELEELYKGSGYEFKVEYGV